jgi:hypothetical protein
MAKRRNDKFWLWAARRIPKTLRYYCCIVAGAEATSGKYDTTIVPELTFVEFLKRVEV